jgi:hypothetical protein
VPLPVTVAVPTVVPPLVQMVGALACGPNTLTVNVPPAPVAAPASVELIVLAAIVALVVAVAGAATVAVVFAFPTTVEGIPAPQALFDALLSVSPP